MSTKAAKEAFVAGHSGTTLSEVNAIAGLVPLATLLFCWSGGGRIHGVARPLAEFALLVTPSIAAMMGPVQPEPIFWCFAAVAAITCVVRLGFGWWQQRLPLQQHLLKAAELLHLRHSRFMSNYRGAMMLSTCIGILAVDFPAFPRRFAKAETFGTGLMDVGVGSFVVASGFASGSRQQHGHSKTALLHSASLVLIGLARLKLTQGMEYQHPVAEYGTHWNFFFTLAAVKLATATVPLSADWSGIAGLLAMAVHQLALSWGGIDIVNASERGVGLLSRNKEGLLSLPGYWALHLLSSRAGRWLHISRLAAAAAALWQQPNGKSAGRALGAPLIRWLLQLAAATTLLWGAALAAMAWLQPTSRRACNASYILWMLAFNWLVLSLFAAADLLAPDPGPHVFAAMNRRMLVLFLAANLLTGLVNMSFDTLAWTDWPARAVVAVYAAVLFALTLWKSPEHGH